MNILQKKLRQHHICMIALGGSIGTGMFLACGLSLSVGGPGSALLAYTLMAVVVYFLMTSLAEMSVHKPCSGTFCDYARTYVGHAFGFALGYNYWLNWAITLSAEILASAVIMHYWFPQVPAIFFCTVFFFAILGFNLFSVHVFATVEYLLSFIKVAVILLFILLGTLSVFYQPHFGLTHWQEGDAPFHHGFMGFITVFLFAGFSFQGTELLGVTSGEASCPQKSIPKAVRLIFFRLTLFYVLTVLLISLLFAYNDPHLISQNNVGASPYTWVFKTYFHHYAADIVNFTVLIAILSAANASMYAASRMLWHLSRMRQAPPGLGRITRSGVPLYTVLATALVASIIFLTAVMASWHLFFYLVQISSLFGFIAWFGIALAHLKFRQAYLPKHGGIRSLRYRSRLYPYAQILCLCVLSFVILGQCIPIISHQKHYMGNLVCIYAPLVIFLMCYAGHRIHTAIKNHLAV